jgi:hypothetical protein
MTSLNDIYISGWDAFHADLRRSDNPWCPIEDEMKYETWDDGWSEAADEYWYGVGDE